MGGRPGIHAAEVARSLGAGWSSVQHHVQQLAREGRIRAVKYRGRTMLVPSSMPPSRVVLVIHTADAIARRLLALLARSPDRRTSEIARSIRSSPKVVKRRLDALVAAGLARRSPHYHPRFAVTPSGRQALRARGA